MLSETDKRYLDVNGDGKFNIMDIVRVINLTKVYDEQSTLQEVIFYMIRDLYPDVPIHDDVPI